MNKEMIKKAFDAAEKSHQEKQVEQIKKIIQSILENIQKLTDERVKIDKKIRILRSDLDDLKAGRLDNIVDRQEKDSEAKEVSVIIIHKIEKEYIPMQPWRSPYEVIWKNEPMLLNNLTCTNLATSGNTITMLGQGVNQALTISGTSFSNFAGGSYIVGDHVVNL